MFSVKVSSDDMKDRLDANFYRPEYLEIEHKLNQLGSATLGSLCNGVECGPFGGNAIADDLYAEQGVAFIRPVNISSHVFDESSLVKVSEQLLIDNKLKIYNGTNLYFGRVGDPCVAVIDRKTSISPNIIVAKTNPELADPHYLWAFGACTFGLKQLLRQLKTVAQPTTSTEAVRNLSVFNASLEAQKYIGDKVRQAEQLRAWAKLCLYNARNKLAENLTRFAPNTYCELQGKDGSLTVCVKSKEIDDRLDSWFYKAEFTKSKRVLMELEDNGISTKPLKSIGTVEYGFMPLEDYWSPCEGHQFLRVTNIKENLIVDSGDVKFVNPIESNAPKYRLKEGDIVVVQLGNSTGRIAYISPKYESWAYPSFALRVRLNNNSGFDSGYTSLFLSEVLGQNQIQRTISITSVRPNTTKPAIESIAIPELSVEEQQIIGTWIREMTAANENSTALISSAKILVEALIEGQLTEQQLIQAQQALDDGDNTLDQAIFK